VTSTHSSGFNQHHIDDIYPNGITFTDFNPSEFNPYEPLNMIKQIFPRTQNLQRLLFSATITDNPRKLAMLGITAPLIFRAANTDINHASINEEGNSDLTLSSSGFILPTSLSESTLVCDAATRPLQMIGLIMESFSVVNVADNDDVDKDLKEDDDHENSTSKSKKNHVVCDKPTDMCLIFSSSVDTTHRLCRLLQIFNGQTDSDNSKNLKFGGKVAEMDSLMTAEQKEVIMKDAAQGNIRVLVSSDNLSRGIDLPNIRIVVNYDAPKFAKTYVHRVGRTARADRAGLAITILKSGQVGTFLKMRSTIGTSSDTKTNAKKSSKRRREDYGLTNCKVEKNTIEYISEDYKKSIRKLSKILQLETKGQFKAGDEIFTEDM
jgi:ATP-dependent RNA helicase DDX51/DBP6